MNEASQIDSVVQWQKRVMDCGRKRSATPLSCARTFFIYQKDFRPSESGVAAALCHRTPRPREMIQPCKAKTYL